MLPMERSGLTPASQDSISPSYSSAIDDPSVGLANGAGPSASASTSAAPALTREASFDAVESLQRHTLPPYTEGEAFASPSGSAAPSAASPLQESFFDIAPRSDATAFQVGYLGLKGFRAWIKGDVLVKLDEASRSNGGYSRCTVELKAVERAPSKDQRHGPSGAATDEGEDEEVELFSAREVVWDGSAATTSAAAGALLPSTMPFSIPLTPDLPHCIHSKRSSLTYHIEARLISSRPLEFPDAVKIVPVHLTRYTRPGPLDQRALNEIDGAELRSDDFSFRPHTWTIHSPTTAYVQINKTIFRRAEPIDVKVRIPPPSEESVTEKGLKLRAVEADLVRIISVKRPNQAAAASADAQREGADVFQSAAEEKAMLARHYEEAAASGSQAEPSSSEPSEDPVAHEALLAHSGKLCRFHSQRPVLLRLTLHPPFDPANMPHPHPDHDALASGPVFGRGGGGGCESISQETVMHTVAFEVRIRVAIMGGRTERRDIACTRKVNILPGAAGLVEEIDRDGDETAPHSLEKSHEKQAEKSRDLGDSSSLGDATGPESMEAELLDFGMDDEYDGYEDVGRGLDELIDQTDGIEAAGSSSSHEERLEQLRQLLERSDEAASHEPPPSLLESQHDLQVEVEVEGVGLAMPRQRHPADTFPDGSHPPDLVLPPVLPPPIDDAAQPHYDDLVRPAYHESVLERPPPPLSPPPADEPTPYREDDEETHFGHLRSMSLRRSALQRSFTEDDPTQSIPSSGRSSPPPPHSPPRLSYTQLEPGPSYEAIVRVEHGHTADVPPSAAVRSHHEPPPYMDSRFVPRSGAASRRDQGTRSLQHDGSDRAARREHDSVTTRVEAAMTSRTLPLHTRASSPSTPPSPPLPTNEDFAHPPAYGTYSSLAAAPADRHAAVQSHGYAPESVGRHTGGPPGYED